MSRRQIQITIALVLIAIIAAASAYYVATRPGDISDRLASSHAKAYDDLAAVETAADKAVREYVAPPGKITDLDSPIAPIIKDMPFVKDVRVTGPAKPTKRINFTTVFTV